MISALAAVNSGMLLAPLAAYAICHGCIQPECVVVHRGLGLVDVVYPNMKGVLERSSGKPGVPIDGIERPVRLMLAPDERIRIRWSPDGASDWHDPMAGSKIGPAADQTPAWALGAVWYNIFPERFDNAEPRNDQGWPHGTALAWDHAWFEVSSDEFEASANRAIAAPMRYRDSDSRERQALSEVVFERRFGGDLQGVTRRLDHIAALGVSGLWLCPVFESVSLHKYDATDHRHIDPFLAWPGKPPDKRKPFSHDPSDWVWSPADRVFLDEVLPSAKSRGLRVILDGVLNHVGTEHPAFKDAARRGPASPYFDWFDFRQDSAGHVVGWRAWDRSNGNLPAFRQLKGDLAPGPKEHMFDITARWMDPNGDGDQSDGIDGWRLDVANEVGMAFWEGWRSHVRAINPEALLIGELWFDGQDYFEGRAFDAQMNYPLAFVLLPWLSGISNPGIAGDLAGVMSHHPATELAQMNLLASHDTARLVSLLANPGLGYDQGAGMTAKGFDRNRPGSQAYERLELAYATLVFLPGSPMIFAGDELGIWGADDPENRKPLPWPDLINDVVLEQLAQTTTQSIGQWLRLRTDAEVGDVLRYGGWHYESSGSLLIIERNLDGRSLRLYVNAGDAAEPSPIGEIGARSARMGRLVQDRGVAFELPSEKAIAP